MPRVGHSLAGQKGLLRGCSQVHESIAQQIRGLDGPPGIPCDTDCLKLWRGASTFWITSRQFVVGPPVFQHAIGAESLELSLAGKIFVVERSAATRLHRTEMPRPSLPRRAMLQVDPDFFVAAHLSQNRRFRHAQMNGEIPICPMYELPDESPSQSCRCSFEVNHYGKLFWSRMLLERPQTATP